MWWERAENDLPDFAVLQSTGGKSFSDYGKSRHHPYLIRAIQTHKGFSFLCNFITLCHLLFPFYGGPSSYTFIPLLLVLPLYVVEKTTNLIKVIGVRDTNNSIRTPRNYRLHLLDTHKRSAVGLSWGPKGHKNLLPIKLST